MKKQRTKSARNAKDLVKAPSCSCGPDELGEQSEEIKAAVEESKRRFLENNRENIRRSGKERIASESYRGGMVDMIMTVRNALGKWGVEQLLTELEKRQRMEDSGEAVHVRVNVMAGHERAAFSPEDAKELGQQIAKWLEERKGKGKSQGKDPMFA